MKHPRELLLRGHQPGDNWDLAGALELGGGGISDSGEVSSWREQEETVKRKHEGILGKKLAVNDFLKVGVITTQGDDEGKGG